MCHCKFIVCDFFRVTAVSVCFDVLFAVFLALFPQEEKRRERENHSPSTVGKANDLSQPLLSPRLAARKLPAVLHTLVTDYIIFQKYQHVIRIEKKKRKKNEEEETGVEP